MRVRIGYKIFGVAVGLLILMAAVALLSLRMTRTVDDQLRILDKNYYPGYVAMARANVATVEESAFIRRLLLAIDEEPRDDAKVSELRTRIADAATRSNDELVSARRCINEQIADPLDFNDNVQLARLDTRLEFLQHDREAYEATFARLMKEKDAGNIAAMRQELTALDERRDAFNRRIEADRFEMSRIADGAIDGTRAYQARVVNVSLVLLLLASLLGVSVAAAITRGLVRPLSRLLSGTAAIEQGLLDTVVPVTSSDEIGKLTEAFNKMVSELRVKERIRDTFGKYVDPRIVAGLIDRPELTDSKGARREMTILFCDMQGFTSFSEGLTPTVLVNVMNRYLTVLSDPVRRNGGIIDKYIGDAVMAFWGRPLPRARTRRGLPAPRRSSSLPHCRAFSRSSPS
jgi:adenylate cyclase